MAAAVLLGVTAGAPAQVVPDGPQFQINSYTDYLQRFGAVATHSDGSFVVVWQSYGSYGPDPDFSIQAQRYAADGLPVGSQFEVNTLILGNQFQPAVATVPSGDFIVVWGSEFSLGSDRSSTSIQMQRFDSAANPLGGQVQVNTYTTAGQGMPSLAVAGDGTFVVVWHRQDYTCSGDVQCEIQGQRFGSDGQPLGGEFQVNSYTTNRQTAAEVATAPDGSFVVVWSSAGSPGSDSDAGSVQGQRFDADGSRLGQQFQINSYTTSNQSTVAVETTPDGGFVTVWQSGASSGSDSDVTSVQVRRFGPQGAPLGTELQVNSYTTSLQEFPAVAVGPDGDFLLVWESVGSSGSDNDSYSVQGQYFDAQGVAAGEQFQVNSYTPNPQFRSAISGGPRGKFTVVWQSYGSFGSDNNFDSIQGQRLLGPAMFADGFESGDTSAWNEP